MMRHLLLFLILSIHSCNFKPSAVNHSNTLSESLIGVSEKGIYAFMPVVIKLLKLNTSFGLVTDPVIHASPLNNDSYFQQLLGDTTSDLNGPFDNLIYIKSDTFTMAPICHISQEDIVFIARQRKQAKQFNWNKAQLGFINKNDTNRYVFTKPLFSTNRRKVFISIAHLCEGLCGSGQNYVFSKDEQGEWTYQTDYLCAH